MQDKAAIDASFDKAFALIEQLATDTAALKAADAERSEKLDSTVRDVDQAMADLKVAGARRDAQDRLVADQVHNLRSMIPQAMQGWKTQHDARIESLATEMQSLKRLLENRLGQPEHGPLTDNHRPAEESDSQHSESPVSASRHIPSKPSIPAWQLAAAINGAS